MAQLNGCVSHLGVSGLLMFWAYAHLRPELSVSKLLQWAQLLQQAQHVHEKKPDRTLRRKQGARVLPAYLPHLSKPQISLWRKSLPEPPVFGAADTQGLCYRTWCLQVLGETVDDKPWQGALLVVLELKTGMLFHHFVGISKSFPPSAKHLLYAICQADLQVQKLSLPDAVRAAKRTIYLPEGGGIETPLSKAWQVTRRLFDANAQSDQVHHVPWMSTDGARMNFSEWQAFSYPTTFQTHVVECTNDRISNAREMGNALNRLAAYTEQLLLAPEHHSMGVDWLSLNPTRARQRLDPRRYGVEKLK